MKAKGGLKFIRREMTNLIMCISAGKSKEKRNQEEKKKILQNNKQKQSCRCRV